jgi:hypothetical protein
MATFDAQAQTRWLDSGDAVALIPAAAGFDRYELTVVTPDDTVWIGGSAMGPGGSFTLPVDSEHGVYGYQLIANKEYTFHCTVDASASSPLCVTTTSAAGATIAVLALPVI